MSMRTERASWAMALMVPRPSTWPLTRWPPMRVEGVIAFSRFTRLPTLICLSEVSDRVSPDTSALKVSPPSRAVTVRQTPLTAMESPSLTSPKSSSALWMRSVTSPLAGVSAATRPWASMMPVNMTVPLCRMRTPAKTGRACGRTAGRAEICRRSAIINAPGDSVQTRGAEHERNREKGRRYQVRRPLNNAPWLSCSPPRRPW